LGAIALTYANALPSAFVYDDYTQIIKNPYIKDWSHARTVLTTGFGRLDKTGSNYYRPLVELSYMVEYSLWKTHRAGYHATSILFHMGSAVLLFLALDALFGNAKAALLTSLLFGVHPIYTSGVTYVAGRADAMEIFFLLLALLFLVKCVSPPDGLRYGPLLMSCGSFLLALLAKEASLFFLFIVLLYGAQRLGPDGTPEDRKKWFAIYGSFFLIAILYGLLRMQAVKALVYTRYNVVASFGILARLLTAVKAFGNYLLLLVAPAGLHFERTIPVANSICEPAVLGSLAALSAVIYVTIRLRKAKGPLYFGLLWFFTFFIPVSNVLVPLNAFIAENWIQVPAIGMFLVASALVARCSTTAARPRILRAACGMALPLFLISLPLYAFLTVTRNGQYRDPIGFYENELRYEKTSVKLLNNLGYEYESRKEINKAIELYKKALAVKPDHVTTLNNLANIYSGAGRYDEAIALYTRALAIDPGNTVFLNNLGVAYIRKGDKRSALYCWRKSLSLNPTQPQIKSYVERNL
jgi:tetratricopeptide (TPR) repeat protein